MNEMDKKARLDVLKEMRKSAMGEMGEGMQSHMKKVTVAAPDTEHLKEGLKKAEDVVSQLPEDSMDESESEDDYRQETDKKLQELVDMCSSPEELDHKIEFLQKAKEEKFGSMPEQDMEE